MNDTKSFMSAILVDKKFYESNSECFESWYDFAFDCGQTYTLWDVTDAKQPVLLLQSDSGCASELMDTFISGCRYLSSEIEFDERNILLCDNYDNPQIEEYFANIISY